MYWHFFREVQIRNDGFSNNLLPFPKKKNLSEIFDRSTQPNNHIFVLWSTDLDTSTFKEFESWIVWQFLWQIDCRLIIWQAGTGEKEWISTWKVIIFQLCIYWSGFFPFTELNKVFFSNHSIAPNNGKIEIVAVRSYASGTLMPFNRNIAKKYSEHFFLEKREILIFTTIILH